MICASLARTRVARLRVDWQGAGRLPFMDLTIPENSVSLLDRHFYGGLMPELLTTPSVFDPDGKLFDDKLKLEIFNQKVRRDARRSEEHTSELQSQSNLVCRLLLEKQ